MVNRRQVLVGMGGIAAVGLPGKVAAAGHNECVSINDADIEELQTLRHVNEERAGVIIANRPFKNVGDLLRLSWWEDPRQPAEMVDGTVKVCEYDVATVETVDDLRPPYPTIDGVLYTRGRVQSHDIEDTGVLWDVGDQAVFAGFRTGGTTVADFRVFSTTEQNHNVAWTGWRDRPHRTILLPLRD